MKLNVLGLSVKVKFLDPEKMPDTLGVYNYDIKTIYIRNNLGTRYTTLILIHELMHALFDRASLNNTISPQLEEMISEIIAITLDENFKITSLPLPRKALNQSILDNAKQ